MFFNFFFFLNNTESSRRENPKRLSFFSLVKKEFFFLSEKKRLKTAFWWSQNGLLLHDSLSHLSVLYTSIEIEASSLTQLNHPPSLYIILYFFNNVK